MWLIVQDKLDFYFVLWKKYSVYFIYSWMLSWVTVYKRFFFFEISGDKITKRSIIWGYVTHAFQATWSLLEESSRAGPRIDSKSRLLKYFGWCQHGVLVFSQRASSSVAICESLCGPVLNHVCFWSDTDFKGKDAIFSNCFPSDFRIAFEENALKLSI